jgi:hypothetical protein
MVGLSSLYDSRKEFYPIYHVAILAFVITVCIPVNLGISKLPIIDVFVLILAGFVSLFMLARNESVGDSLLIHLRIKGMMPQKRTMMNLHAQKYGTIPLNAYEEYMQEPFFLLQNIVEHIIITHDEEMDLATRVRLENVHQRLQMVTRQLSRR